MKQKVKKINNGKYRVYGVASHYGREEVRYAKRYDADDYILRCGGYLIWKDFDNEHEAQAYLNEKMGETWW